MKNQTKVAGELKIKVTCPYCGKICHFAGAGLENNPYKSCEHCNYKFLLPIRKFTDQAQLNYYLFYIKRTFCPACKELGKTLHFAGTQGLRAHIDGIFISKKQDKKTTNAHKKYL